MSELKTTSLSHKDNNTGTPNITMYPDGTTSLNYAATTFKNQLINGGLDIQQRSGGQDGGSGYVTDRWYVGSSTPSDINTATATFPGQEFARYVRIGNGIGARNVFKQCIELPAGYVGGKAGAFIQGSTWTFSFYHNPSTAAPADGQFGFADNSGNSNAVATNLAAFTDVTGDTASGWQRKSVTFTISITPNAGNICAYIQFSGDNTECTGFQLEPGPVATVFENIPISVELSMCQRYYYAFSYDDDLTFLYLMQINANARAANGFWPVQMRTVPDVTSSLNSGSLSNSAFTNKMYYLQLGIASTDSNSFFVNALTADAEL
jgi:hypothetical protein